MIWSTYLDYLTEGLIISLQKTVHSRALLPLFCLGNTGRTALCFTLCFGKTSGRAGGAATHGCADCALQTLGRATHIGSCRVAQCAACTSVHSSSKSVIGLVTLSASHQLTTDWGWGRLKRRWLWSREVFHDSRFSSQAKPFLLTLD